MSFSFSRLFARPPEGALRPRTPEQDFTADPPSRSAPGRRSWVDAVRGLGILLVVIGHTLRGLGAAELLPDTPLWSFLDRFIYSFHMPLFFFVAGLFLVPAPDEKYLDFAQRRLVRLGYPYLLWASLQTLSQVLLSRYTNHAAGMRDFLALGFEPPMQFWFLYALLLQTLFLGLLAKLGLERTGILVVAVLLFLSAPWLPLGNWSPPNQARTYLIYTALGVFVGAPTRIDLVERGRPAGYLGAVLLGYALVAFAAFQRATPLNKGIVAPLVAATGILASISLCVLLSHIKRPAAAACSAILVRWGEASMAIFVAHTLASAAVRIGLDKVLHVRDAGVHFVLGTVVGIGVPWALFMLSKRWAFPYLFEWPMRARRRESTLARSSRPSMESPAS